MNQIPPTDHRIETLESQYPSLLASMTSDQKIAFIKALMEIPDDQMKSFLKFADPFFAAKQLTIDEKIKTPGIFPLFNEKKIDFSENDTPDTKILLIQALASIAPSNREPVIALIVKKLCQSDYQVKQFCKMPGSHKGDLFKAMARIPPDEDQTSIIAMISHSCDRIPYTRTYDTDGCGMARIITAIIELPVVHRDKILEINFFIHGARCYVEERVNKIRRLAQPE